MNYIPAVVKLREMAQKQEDLGNIDGQVAIENEIQNLQTWIDAGQPDACPVDLGKYGLQDLVTPEADPTVVSKKKPAVSVPVEEATAGAAGKVKKGEPSIPETADDAAETLKTLVGEAESPEQIELRRQLEQVRQFIKSDQLQEAVSLAGQIEARASDASLKESAKDLLDQARQQLNAALKKALADGDKAHASGKTDIARKHYETAQKLDPQNERAKNALLDLSGALATKVTDARITKLRSGLMQHKDIHLLGEAVYEAEALHGENKLPEELLEILKEARAAYDQIRKSHGEETTQARFGDLGMRSKAVAKIRERVAVGEKLIYDSTTNTERPAYDLLREAEEYLNQASEDAAQYELDLAEKQKNIYPRYAKERLEKALEQPLSENYIRLLREKLDEINALVRVQEKSESLLAQAQEEGSPVKVYRLVLQAQQIFSNIPGLVEQVKQARQIALNTLAVETDRCLRDAKVAFEAALVSGEYQTVREKTSQVDKLVASWPEEATPPELKKSAQEADTFRQKIDTTENQWNEFKRLRKSVLEQIKETGHRAAALELFREIGADPRFKNFPDLRILTSEIDNYKGVTEQLSDAQSARAEGDWERVFEITEKVNKSGKAGSLAEKFTELYDEATIELAISRAKTLLDDDDVPEANNNLSAVFNRVKGTPREAVLEERLREERSKIKQCILDNPPMQAQYDRACELIGFRDSPLLKAYINPTFSLRQARIHVEGQATNPEMRTLINSFKKNESGKDPTPEELSRRAGVGLHTELSHKGVSERLDALRLFRYVGGDLTQCTEKEKGEWRRSLRTAEARRAGRLLAESMRRDALLALMKAYDSRAEKELSDNMLQRRAEEARGLREAELLESEDEKDAGRWLEVEWGRRQAQIRASQGDWPGSVSVLKDLDIIFKNPETRRSWREARITQAVENARDLVQNHHQGEEALAVLEATKVEEGIGSSWKVEIALTDTYAVLGKFNSAYGSLDEAKRFAPKDKEASAELDKAQKKLDREKIVQTALAEAQAKKMGSPRDALKTLRDALAKPQAKDSNRLREMRDKIFSQTTDQLLKSAKKEQSVGSEDSKLKALTLLVDLQELEELVGEPAAKRQSRKEIGSLRNDLPAVAESVIRTVQDFNPAVLPVEAAISQAESLSSRIQTFSSIGASFPEELRQVTDRLGKRQKEITRLLDNLKKLQVLVTEASAPPLWESALQSGDFQPLENYTQQLGQFELSGMREVQDFDKWLSEWKEVRAYLLKEIGEIKKKFSPEEVFDDVKVRLKRMISLPGFRLNGQPWQRLTQREYESILQVMDDKLRINDLYGDGELVGRESLGVAVKERQEELDAWLSWDKDCAERVEALQAIGAATGNQAAEFLEDQKKNLEKQMDAAQSLLAVLDKGPYIEDQAVGVHSHKAEIAKANIRRRREMADMALREAVTRIQSIDDKNAKRPSPDDLNRAATQTDWNLLENSIKSIEELGYWNMQEKKRVDTYKAVLAKDAPDVEKETLESREIDFMRIAVLSDLHANYPALQAVLSDAAGQNIDMDAMSFWCLGDVVGYGPHPVDVLLFLERYVDPQGWVLGNHDAMLADLLLPVDLEEWDEPEKLVRVVTQQGAGAEIVARGQLLEPAVWAQTNASPVKGIELNRVSLASNAKMDAYWRKEFNREHLGPVFRDLEKVDFTLVHGSQTKPLSRLIYPWNTEILIPKELSLLQKRSQENKQPQVQLFAHTHVPALIRAQPGAGVDGLTIQVEKTFPGEVYSLDANFNLINPGSVGQPRNLDRRAQYAILDTKERTVTFRRVEYDWRETARDLQAEGYPDSFINRLKTAAAVEETPEEWLTYYREAAEK